MSNADSPLTLGQLIDGICEFNYVSFVSATRTQIVVNIALKTKGGIARRIYNHFTQIDAYNAEGENIVFEFILSTMENR